MGYNFNVRDAHASYPNPLLFLKSMMAITASTQARGSSIVENAMLPSSRALIHLYDHLNPCSRTGLWSLAISDCIRFVSRLKHCPVSVRPTPVLVPCLPVLTVKAPHQDWTIDLRSHDRCGGMFYIEL